MGPGGDGGRRGKQWVSNRALSEVSEAWPSRAAAVNAAGEALLAQLRKWNALAKTMLAATAEIKRLRAGE